MKNNLCFIDLPNVSINEADILILPVPFERTVSFKKGTSLAPKAILNVSEHLEYYEEDNQWSPFKHMNVCVLPMFEIDSQTKNEDWNSSLVSYVNNLPNDKLLVTIGGEHSITPPIVKGRMNNPGTIIYLDAHADMRSSYQGSTFNHACPVTHLIEQGHEVVIAGVRSLCEAEAKLAKGSSRISIYMDRDLQEGTRMWEQLMKKINTIEGDVYLSVDMDVLEPGYVPGVGTPLPGGFSWYQTTKLLGLLFKIFMKNSIQLRGVDIVEMVPESSRISEMVAAKLIMKIISHWGLLYGFNKKPEIGGQLLAQDD